MPLVQTRGAASAQGFGEFAQVTAVNYIEDVFSTYLYTGNGSTQTITNGIDLSTKGGLLWIKNRASATYPGNYVFDSARGAGSGLITNTTAAADGSFSTGFTTSGFTLAGDNATDQNTITYVSWTFREQPKFFDVVTYTGTGSNTTIAHSLGSVPGSIIVKRTDTTAAWAVYHRSLANTQYLVLNTTAAVATGATWWNSTTPTSAVFSVGTDASVNASGGTYVAYLFAHDAGGFGLAGTDNVISCGGFTTSVNPDTITLGYEPQWVLIKSASSGTNWYIFDNMRGIPTGGNDSRLMPNLSSAESTDANYLDLTATGFISNFQAIFGDGIDLIYIAIRRGPMKVPTLGTSVFSPNLSAATTGTVVTTNFPIDLHVQAYTLGPNSNFIDRLRGVSSTSTASGPYLQSASTAAEVTPGSTTQMFNNTGFQITAPFSGASTAYWNFGRAPGFFDEVCYTGTNVAGNTINHNLTVAPELIIIKRRATGGTYWDVSTLLGATTYTRLFFDTDALYLGTPQTYGVAGVPLYSKPTATQLQFGVNSYVNASDTYVAYLFATCAGVSKVGSYTGTATTLQIDCGFTGGARFVLIKRTDSTGDWYVWDSARGIIAGNDPYLLLNSTAAEVTNTDYVDTYSAGFEISSTAPAAINASAGTFVFLAIA
jgi:hypothetical protein